MNVRSSAHVLVTLEIAIPDVWGGDCTADQLFKQAAASAIDIARRIPQARVVGEPKVTAVHTTRTDQ